MFGVLRNASDIDLSKNILLVTDWHCKDGFVLYDRSWHCKDGFVLYDRSSKLDMMYFITRGSYKGLTNTYRIKFLREYFIKKKFKINLIHNSEWN
jgi:hypothetical protein